MAELRNPIVQVSAIKALKEHAKALGTTLKRGHPRRCGVGPPPSNRTLQNSLRGDVTHKIAD